MSFRNGRERSAEDILPALTCLRLHSRSLWRRVFQRSGASPDENTVDNLTD